MLIPTSALLNAHHPFLPPPNPSPPSTLSLFSVSKSLLWYQKSIKNLPNLTPEKQIIQWRNGQKTWIDTSPKKISRWPTDTWKNVPHHSSSGKYKSKPQRDTTSHLSEWLILTTQATTDAGKDVEKEDLFCIIGGNASWCSHSGKQYGGSSTN